MMRASDFLGSLDTRQFRLDLLPIRPESVVVRPVPGRVRRVWPDWASAMTMPWGIYVRPDVLGGAEDTLARIIAHELVHARQWKTKGVVGFLLHYLSDYLKGRARRMGHREAYRAIRLEAEAYDIVKRL